MSKQYQGIPYYLCIIFKHYKNMNRTILDRETDCVCFSTYIRNYEFWDQMQMELERNHIRYGFIPMTNDIWVRDFMPIETLDGFYQYLYLPDYLVKKKEWHNYISNPFNCFYRMTNELPKQLPIVLDGGNIIKAGDYVIMTDKVFHENKTRKDKLVGIIKDCLGVKPVFIPWDKAEPYGHADGMVRYVGDDTVLINNYCDIDSNLRKRLVKALNPYFDIKELHYDAEKQSRLNWAYINYLEVRGIVFMPMLDIPEDKLAYYQLKELLDERIIPIRCPQIVKKGGGLNCVSWNVKYNASLFRDSIPRILERPPL